MILSLNVVSQGRGQIFPFRIVHKGVNPYPIPYEKNFPKIVMAPQKESSRMTEKGVIFPTIASASKKILKPILRPMTLTIRSARLPEKRLTSRV